MSTGMRAGLLLLSVLGVSGLVVAAPPSDPIAPLWSGTLDAGGVKLRLVVHLARGADGTLTATLDSVDQGATGLPVDGATYDDRKLVLDLARMGARYEGTMNEAGTALTGTWTQGGAALPLVLTATAEAPKLARPQEPRGALPYRAEEVTFRNEAAGVTLAGTLTLPEGGGPFPAVVLISGSGPEDRDETVFGHRPFLVLADYLTRRGIAVLRHDDRGVGESSAGPPTATSEDLAGDTLAGVALLARRPEIDRRRIGLAGHSEGGLIAPLAATRPDSGVAFVVLMAAPGLPGEEILHAQSAAILKAAGAPASQIAEARELNAKVYGIVKSEPDRLAAERKLRELAATWPDDARKALETQIPAVVTPWFRFFLTYDPRPTLAKLTVPLLAIQGEKDLQVPAEPNVAAIRAALEGAGHRDHALVVLPGLNHLFQTSATGSPAEYGQLEETFAPAALKTVADFILERAKPR